MILKERFESKVDKKTSNECWNWKAGCFKRGYGQFDYKNKNVKAHRLAWELTHGPIPEGMCVLHHCDNPPCCNPNHLFLGTKKDNTQDMINKGRCTKARGENHGNSKLTNEQRNKIIELGKTKQYRQYELADMFGVSQTHICRIINNKRRKYIVKVK